jgi:hydrogenase/urease accessory protein HupE
LNNAEEKPSMQITYRPSTFAAALLAPAFAQAHTGSDAGGHHNFLDALLYAVSDLNLPALMLALGVWGAIFAAKVAARRRKQHAIRSCQPRDRA